MSSEEKARGGPDVEGSDGTGALGDNSSFRAWWDTWRYRIVREANWKCETKIEFATWIAREAYEAGTREGATAQAIIECQARDRFQRELREKGQSGG